MKPMNSDDQKRRMAALAEGKRIVTKRYRNPVYGSRSLKQNVEEDLGNPAPARVDKKEAAKKAMDKFFNRGPGGDVSKLPRAGGAGNPKDDLNEISGQLKKASNLHANQSERVSKISKKIKSGEGNPYMKKSKSQYGM